MSSPLGLSTLEQRGINELKENNHSGKSLYSSWTSFEAILNRRASRIPVDGMDRFVHLAVTAASEAVSDAPALADLLAQAFLRVLADKGGANFVGSESWIRYVNQFEGSFLRNRDGKDAMTRATCSYVHFLLCERVLNLLVKTTNSMSVVEPSTIQGWLSRGIEDLWSIYDCLLLSPPISSSLSEHQSADTTEATLTYDKVVLRKIDVLGRLLQWSACAPHQNGNAEGPDGKLVHALLQGTTNTGVVVLMVCHLIFGILCRSKSAAAHMNAASGRHGVSSFLETYTVDDAVAIRAAQQRLDELEAALQGVSSNAELPAFSELMFAKAFCLVVGSTPPDCRGKEVYARLIDFLMERYGMNTQASALRGLDWRALALSFR